MFQICMFLEYKMANKKVAPLTDTEIKNLKPKNKEYTKSDGNGLQLLVKNC